jgi:DNA polymerase-3 subunit delta'
MFDLICGNEPLKVYLKKALQQEMLPQTLLFAGPDGVGKSLFAKELAVHLLQTSLSRIEQGNHPDFSLLRPEGKSGVYAIDSIRALIDASLSSPYEAKRKVFVLEYAERMQPASANALLKTLEEPSPHSLFILLSSAPQEILPTILSRCVQLSFQPVPEKEIARLLEAKGLSAQFAKLAQGSVGRAFELAEHPELEMHRKLLFSLLAHPESYLDVSKGVAELEKSVEEEEDPIRSHRYVDHLFAYILMWHRDQHVRREGELGRFLFFPEEAAHTGPLRSLESVQKSLDEARAAYLRNMKLSFCLDRVLSQRS